MKSPLVCTGWFEMKLSCIKMKIAPLNGSNGAFFDVWTPCSAIINTNIISCQWKCHVLVKYVHANVDTKTGLHTSSLCHYLIKRQFYNTLFSYSSNSQVNKSYGTSGMRWSNGFYDIITCLWVFLMSNILNQKVTRNSPLTRTKPICR